MAGSVGDADSDLRTGLQGAARRIPRGRGRGRRAGRDAALPGHGEECARGAGQVPADAAERARPAVLDAVVEP